MCTADFLYTRNIYSKAPCRIAQIVDNDNFVRTYLFMHELHNVLWIIGLYALYAMYEEVSICDFITIIFK